MLAPWKKNYENLGSILKGRDITLLTKVYIVKAMVFPVVMYGCELDHKELWVLKNWCFQTVVLEKILENLLHGEEIKPVSSKGNQHWICIGKPHADSEAPILWPPDTKSQLLLKHADAGKDWRQEERGMIEDEMVGWHHWLNGHEFEQILGSSEGEGCLVCCSPWSRKVRHNLATEQQKT